MREHDTRAEAGTVNTPEGARCSRSKTWACSSAWERSRPYQERHPEIDPADTHILRLLLAGLTDTAVAGQLDLSVRTVQRRLQTLMARAGVTSRLQLDWHACRYGWV